jgi:hypothetical protein
MVNCDPKRLCNQDNTKGLIVCTMGGELGSMGSALSSVSALTKSVRIRQSNTIKSELNQILVLNKLS